MHESRSKKYFRRNVWQLKRKNKFPVGWCSCWWISLDFRFESICLLFSILKFLIPHSNDRQINLNNIFIFFYSLLYFLIYILYSIIYIYLIQYMSNILCMQCNNILFKIEIHHISQVNWFENCTEKKNAFHLQLTYHRTNNSILFGKSFLSGSLLIILIFNTTLDWEWRRRLNECISKTHSAQQKKKIHWKEMLFE